MKYKQAKNTAFLLLCIFLSPLAFQSAHLVYHNKEKQQHAGDCTVHSEEAYTLHEANASIECLVCDFKFYVNEMPPQHPVSNAYYFFISQIKPETEVFSFSAFKGRISSRAPPCISG